ncbi:MAG: hypothetical protein AAF943_11510 [Pseudomonadota bacterium]
MRIAALFLWLAFPLAGYGIYAAYGTPHVIWEYTFRDNGARYDPFAQRIYTSCTYLGWGLRPHRVPARDARCPWVQMFKVPVQ